MYQIVHHILLCFYFQVWADDGHNDDWRCVQPLGESNRYPTLFLLTFSGMLKFNELIITMIFSGHSSTVLALSFNSTGDKMVTCRYSKLVILVFNC